MDGGHGIPWPKRKQTQGQRRQRRQKYERAFLLTVAGHCLGAVGRVPWEVALADDGGNGAEAVMACSLADMPKGTTALWDRSAAEA
jgi:hypothetical protein